MLQILDSTERAVEHSPRKHWPRYLTSSGGLLADLQDDVLPVAAHLYDDLHVFYGGSAYTHHLSPPRALAVTNLTFGIEFLTGSNMVVNLM